MLQRAETLVAGGSTARPTQARFGSKKLRKVLIPAFALFRSVHAGSLAPELSWHIEPVRSSTSITSTGREPHGEHAVALTLILNELNPRTFEKNVGTVAVSLTETELTGLQPGIVAMQLVLIDSVTGTLLPTWLLPLEDAPYCVATEVAEVGSGSCCAPASAAASAVACRLRCVR